MQERGRDHPSAASVFPSFTHALYSFSQKALVLGKEPNQSNRGCWILTDLLKSFSLQRETWTLPINPLTHTPIFLKITKLFSWNYNYKIHTHRPLKKHQTLNIFSNVAHEILPWATGFELKLRVVSFHFLLWDIEHRAVKMGWRSGNWRVRDLLQLFHEGHQISPRCT